MDIGDGIGDGTGCNLALVAIYSGGSVDSPQEA